MRYPFAAWTSTPSKPGRHVGVGHFLRRDGVKTAAAPFLPPLRSGMRLPGRGRRRQRSDEGVCHEYQRRLGIAPCQARLMRLGTDRPRA